MPKHRLNKNNAQAAQALSQSQALTLPIVELDDSPKPFLIPELDTHSPIASRPTSPASARPSPVVPSYLVRMPSVFEPGQTMPVPDSAKWHSLNGRPILVLIYPASVGAWIWESQTSGVSSMVSLDIAHVVATAVLPSGLLAVLSRTAVTVHSLSTGATLQRVAFLGSGTHITASRTKLIISTIKPSALHVACTRTWKVVQTIPDSDLVRLTGDFDSSSPQPPIYAHAGRLLAFACAAPTPPLQASPTASPVSPTSSAALALGDTALTMLRYGGRALSAAIKRFDNGTNGTGGPKFFSTSAPAATAAPAPHEPVESTSNIPDRGSHIRVIDLDGSEVPRIVSEFSAPSADTIAVLSFSQDGTVLCVSGRDGRNALLFKIRVNPCLTRDLVRSSDFHPPLHQYTLHRGITSASISDMGWASDGRWVGLATRNRTIHIFRIDPTTTTPAEEYMGAVLRSRPQTKTKALEPELPLAFTFINIPSPASTTHTHILTYDPHSNVITLRLILLTSKEHFETSSSIGALSLPTSLSLTSSSLPLRFSGTSISPTLGFLSSSPSSATGAMESTVASWILNHSTHGHSIQPPHFNKPVRANYLAQSELTTTSGSKSIYLSHQFTFLSLGVEFQTLLRGHQLHIRGDPISVRRQVSVSVHPSERMALAIEGSFEPTDRSRVLPMLPNGYPNSSTRKGIPIGRVVGLGREVVNTYNARSPRLPGYTETEFEGAGVSLEFDEEDEDFTSTPPVPDMHEQLWEVDDIQIGVIEPQRLAPQEEFEHIEVLGVLDEEEEERRQQEKEKEKRKTPRTKRRTRK